MQRGIEQGSKTHQTLQRLQQRAAGHHREPHRLEQARIDALVGTEGERWISHLLLDQRDQLHQAGTRQACIGTLEISRVETHRLAPAQHLTPLRAGQVEHEAGHGSGDMRLAGRDIWRHGSAGHQNKASQNSTGMQNQRCGTAW